VVISNVKLPRRGWCWLGGLQHQTMYKAKVKQHHYPYWLWEDYINGMWRKESTENENSLLKIAIEFTGNHIEYGKSMIRVINEWPITCLQNLTNNDINQRAFIGHCACCLEHNIPEYIVRKAWWELTDMQRDLANGMADEAIKQWQDNYFKQLKTKTNAKNQIRIDGF